MDRRTSSSQFTAIPEEDILSDVGPELMRGVSEGNLESAVCFSKNICRSNVFSASADADTFNSGCPSTRRGSQRNGLRKGSSSLDEAAFRSVLEDKKMKKQNQIRHQGAVVQRELKQLLTSLLLDKSLNTLDECLLSFYEIPSLEERNRASSIINRTKYLTKFFFKYTSEKRSESWFMAVMEGPETLEYLEMKTVLSQHGVWKLLNAIYDDAVSGSSSARGGLRKLSLRYLKVAARCRSPRDYYDGKRNWHEFMLKHDIRTSALAWNKMSEKIQELVWLFLAYLSAVKAQVTQNNFLQRHGRLKNKPFPLDIQSLAEYVGLLQEMALVFYKVETGSIKSFHKPDKIAKRPSQEVPSSVLNDKSRDDVIVKKKPPVLIPVRPEIELIHPSARCLVDTSGNMGKYFPDSGVEKKTEANIPTVSSSADVNIDSMAGTLHKNPDPKTDILTESSKNEQPRIFGPSADLPETKPKSGWSAPPRDRHAP